MLGRGDPTSATGASVEEIPSREFPCPQDPICHGSLRLLFPSKLFLC